VNQRSHYYRYKIQNQRCKVGSRMNTSIDTEVPQLVAVTVIKIVKQRAILRGKMRCRSYEVLSISCDFPGEEDL
jgi:hypothetical protein